MQLNILNTEQLYKLSEQERYNYFCSLDFEVSQILKTVPECDKVRFISTLNKLINNGTDKELLKQILNLSFNAGEISNSETKDSDNFLLICE